MATEVSVHGVMKTNKDISPKENTDELKASSKPKHTIIPMKHFEDDPKKKKVSLQYIDYHFHLLIKSDHRR